MMLVLLYGLAHNTYPTLKPRLVAYPTLKLRLVEHTDTHTHADGYIFWDVSIRNSLRSNKNEHVRSDPVTHHDIVKQYSKGLAAVVDRCVRYSSCR